MAWFGILLRVKMKKDRRITFDDEKFFRKGEAVDSS